MINVPEEHKADCTNLVDDMGSVRKGIHLRYSPGARELNDIFSYFHNAQQDNKEGGNEQVTLGITDHMEDRRGN